MTGFLQRLASGVLHPESAIHPTVGTVWSAPGMTGPAEPFESSVDVGVPPLARGADAPALAATQPSIQQVVKSPIQSRRSAAIPETAVQALVEADDFQPLVAFPHRKGVSALPPVPHAAADPQQSHANSAVRPQATSPERTGPRPLPRIEVARPLVPAQAGAPTAPSFLPPSPRQAQPAPSLAQEPDSIEIHIGRIEVLAAPPRPAQQVAPRPARKSLDLAEYLRGNRRSR
jgi:hypothetical protein